jgi:hypothetical protein
MMSETAQNLIDAFTALSAQERYAVLVELARISEEDAGAITDEELTFAGEKLFAMYDAEEAGNADTSAG